MPEQLADRDAAAALTTVKAALLAAQKDQLSGKASGPVIVDFGNDTTQLGGLRKSALIIVDGQVGSARPVVGRAIRFTKRVIRRLLRWYIKPPFEQQSAVNMGLINALQQLQVQHDELKTELILLRNEIEQNKQ